MKMWQRIYFVYKDFSASNPTNRFWPVVNIRASVCSFSLSLSRSSYIYLTRIGVTVSRAKETSCCDLLKLRLIRGLFYTR